MAELQVSQEEKIGILKEIDSGAMDLVFQAMQEDIYSKPIDSFIRETVSNSIDSTKERYIANEIINMGVPVEEYYRQENDGKLLKDSQFTPEYFKDYTNLGSKSKVMVKYQDSSSGRDLFSIRDYGVGLHSERLKGYFKIGYSTKRNMKGVIGKYGVGAKSALATGVDFYVMTTYHNGYKTSFMIYKHDYEPITPQHEDGKSDEWKVNMANGMEAIKTIFWEPTLEANGVCVEIEVKSHNKDKYIKALKDQFTYLHENITFRVNGQDESLDPGIVYDGNSITIARSSRLVRPHIIVDGINYGFVSWDELELKPRDGNIGLKVAATDVDITQSRESLKWTEKTKKTVLRLVKEAEDEALVYISSQIGDTDYNLIEALVNTSYDASNDYGDVMWNFRKFVGSVTDAKTVKFKKDGITYTMPVSFENMGALLSNYSINKVRIRARGEVDNKVMDPSFFSFSSGGALVYGKHRTPLSAKAIKATFNKIEQDNVETFFYIRPKFSEAQLEDAEEQVTINPINLLVSCEEDINIESLDLTGDQVLSVMALIQEQCDFDLSIFNIVEDEAGTEDVIKHDSAAQRAKERRRNNQYIFKYMTNVYSPSFPERESLAYSPSITCTTLDFIARKLNGLNEVVLVPAKRQKEFKFLLTFLGRKYPTQTVVTSSEKGLQSLRLELESNGVKVIEISESFLGYSKSSNVLKDTRLNTNMLRYTMLFNMIYSQKEKGMSAGQISDFFKIMKCRILDIKVSDITFRNCKFAINPYHTRIPSYINLTEDCDFDKYGAKENLSAAMLELCQMHYYMSNSIGKDEAANTIDELCSYYSTLYAIISNEHYTGVIDAENRAKINLPEDSRIDITLPFSEMEELVEDYKKLLENMSEQALSDLTLLGGENQEAILKSIFNLINTIK